MEKRIYNVDSNGNQLKLELRGIGRNAIDEFANMLMGSSGAEEFAEMDDSEFEGVCNEELESYNEHFVLGANPIKSLDSNDCKAIQKALQRMLK